MADFGKEKGDSRREEEQMAQVDRKMKDSGIRPLQISWGSSHGGPSGLAALQFFPIQHDISVDKKILTNLIDLFSSNECCFR